MSFEGTAAPAKKLSTDEKKRHRLRRWPVAIGFAGLLGLIGFGWPAEMARGATLAVGSVPAYQGPFQGLVDASVYIFDGRPVQLLGVIDPKPITAQHKAYVLKTVHQILDGKTLTCYSYGEGIHYQCYVDQVDLAVILLRKGLVIASHGAPPEYVSANPQ